MRKTKGNNMLLIHGFILVTILATAKSAEAEITMEAAFQGNWILILYFFYRHTNIHMCMSMCAFSLTN